MRKRLPAAISVTATAGAVFCSVPAALPHAFASLAGIIAAVLAICVVTGILEFRCWLHRIATTAGPLMRLSRLPEPCVLAFVASFASGNVAALMLADGRREGRVTRREMIAGALCCSVPPVFMFTGCLALPVIGILGWAGALYFAVSFGTMALALLLFLLAARMLSGRGGGGMRSVEAVLPLPWSEVRRRVAKRTLGFLVRLLLLTVPFYLWTSCVIQRGWLNFRAPESWGAFLSPGALTVLGARFGGLLASSGAAAELLKQRQITIPQLVIALLIGNILNGIIRMVRRGLPVSMGIYPKGDGALIAVAGVGTRMVLTALAVAVIWSLQ